MSYFDRTSPPKGWTVSSGRLEPDTTVAGYLARGREVWGRCEVRDCRRTMHLDFTRMVEHGLGRVPVYMLKPLFRCGRMGSCALDYYERHGVEFTLSDLAGLDHVGVRIGCGHCKKSGTYKAADVAAKLKAEESGGMETKVDQLAGLVKGACPKCKARRWEVAIMWHNRGAVPSWRVANYPNQSGGFEGR